MSQKKQAVTDQKNFMMLLASFLVVAFGVMSYVIFNQNERIEALNDSIESIEKDLEVTNFDNIDKEVLGIETELTSD